MLKRSSTKNISVCPHSKNRLNVFQALLRRFFDKKIAFGDSSQQLYKRFSWWCLLIIQKLKSGKKFEFQKTMTSEGRWKLTVSLFLSKVIRKKRCSRDSPTPIMSNDATNNALLQSDVNHIPALLLSLLIGPRWNECLFAVIEDTRFPKTLCF